MYNTRGVNAYNQMTKTFVDFINGDDSLIYFLIIPMVPKILKGKNLKNFQFQQKLDPRT